MKLKQEQIVAASAKAANSKQETIAQNDEIKAWQPTFKWFAIAGSAVLIFLVIAFFVGNFVLRPYMIDVPKAITPWLDNKKEIPPFVPAFDVNKDIK
ncbi:MAG: hypothetical protein LBT79_06240 [Elusimicrobiota bacterium]|jgi:ABC-type proline/glycine betaine transport system permease subunit|nr:hypothetical protein [Elusimicrobiota bacterium]